MSVRALCPSSESVRLQPSSCAPSLVHPRSRTGTCLPSVRPALTSPDPLRLPFRLMSRGRLRTPPVLPPAPFPSPHAQLPPRPPVLCPSLLASGAGSRSPHSVGRQGKQRGRREGPGVQASDPLSSAHSGRTPSTGTVTRSRASRPVTTHAVTTRPALPATTALPVGLPSPTMTGTS